MRSELFGLISSPDRFDEILQVRLFSVSAQLLLRPEGVRTPPAPEPYYSRIENIFSHTVLWITNADSDPAF
jgi:hypothetical protein